MKLQIIIGSTRPGRVSHKIAKWVANEAQKVEGINPEIVDLADYEMPLFNEPDSPQYNPNRKPETVVDKWLLKLAEADGYILVTPEYNRSTSGVLKNAIDYIDYQLEKKPVALVGHGATGGAQAVSHLRGIMPGVLAVTVPRATYFNGRVDELLDEEGNLKAGANVPTDSIQTLLKDLKWFAEALAVARTSQTK